MKLSIALLVVLASASTLKVSAVPVSGRSNRNLKDDLNDFLSLIPKEKIEDLFFEYLADDEDFGEALDFVLSEEFKNMIIEIESMAEVKELLEFLQVSGLDAYGFINKINGVLGIEKSSRVILSKPSRITGGLPGFIEDVKALLPVEEIEKMYNDKLKNSEDFAALVKQLQSQEFQGLVDKIMANPTLQDVIARAEAKGVNVQAILDFITSLLGLKFPTKPVFFAEEEEVIDILRLIWSKVPLDAILDVVVDYLLVDEDFQRVVQFMMSDEFKVILVDIEELDEIKALLKFLNETGMDIYTILNNFHALIGLDKQLPAAVGTLKITGGIRGLLQDIRALLPREELNAIFDEKYKTSYKFREFIHRLEDKELQNAVDALAKNEGFNTLLNRLEALGVDFNKVVEVIGAIIGIKFPPRPF